MLLNLYAVHTVVLAHFMLPVDRLTLRKLAGALIGSSGIAVLFARHGPAAEVTPLGDTLMLVSGVVLGVRTIYLARTVQHLDPVYPSENRS